MATIGKLFDSGYPRPPRVLKKNWVFSRRISNKAGHSFEKIFFDFRLEKVILCRTDHCLGNNHEYVVFMSSDRLTFLFKNLTRSVGKIFSRTFKFCIYAELEKQTFTEIFRAKIKLHHVLQNIQSHKIKINTSKLCF